MAQVPTATATLDGLTAVIEAAFKPLESTLNALASTMSSLAQVADSASRGMELVGGTMRKVAATAFLPLAGALETFAAATTGPINQMLAFVTRASPAAAMQFNMALDDLAATLGQILMPVFVAVTGFIREMADVFQGLKPALEPVMKGIGDVIGELSKLLAPMAELLVPALELIGFVIQEIIVPAVKLFVEAMKGLIDIIKDLLRAIGVEFRDFDKGNSKGAAVRGASYGSGSSAIQEIGNRSTVSALKIGMKPEKNELLDETKRQHETIKDILRTIGKQIFDRAIKPLEGTLVEDYGRWLDRQLQKLR